MPRGGRASRRLDEARRADGAPPLRVRREVEDDEFGGRPAGRSPLAGLLTRAYSDRQRGTLMCGRTVPSGNRGIGRDESHAGGVTEGE